jgi:predicted transposase YdaD
VKAETAATVELSQQAQAQLLRQQGMGIPQIALQLRLDVKTVTSFFPLSETQS